MAKLTLERAGELVLSDAPVVWDLFGNLHKIRELRFDTKSWTVYTTRLNRGDLQSWTCEIGVAANTLFDDDPTCGTGDYRRALAQVK